MVEWFLIFSDFIFMRKPIPEADLTEEDANQLIDCINASNLSGNDIKIAVGLILFYSKW